MMERRLRRFHAVSLVPSICSLTDITMPHLNGIELCRRITKERPDTRVLLMYGNRPADGSRVPFLQRPFKMQELRAKVREVIAEPVLYPMHPCHDTSEVSR